MYQQYAVLAYIWIIQNNIIACNNIDLFVKQYATVYKYILDKLNFEQVQIQLLSKAMLFLLFQ